MSSIGALLPPIRGGLSNNSYLFRYDQGGDTLVNYILCQLDIQATTTSPIQSILCFSPYLNVTNANGKVTISVDQLQGGTSLKKIVSLEGAVSDVLKISVVAFPVTNDKDNVYNFGFPPTALAPSPIKGTIDNVDGYSNINGKPDLYASFPYNISITNTSIYTFQTADTSSESNGFSFTFINPAIGSTDTAIYGPISSFTGYFVPAVYYYNFPQCTSVVQSFNALSPVYLWSSDRSKLDCNGQVSKDNYCGWVDPAECGHGYLYQYCTGDTTCGTCYGSCSNQDYCVVVNDNGVILSCNATPVGPTPTPGPSPSPPSENSFWKKYGRSIIITSIIVGVFILIAVYIGWIIPKEKPTPLPAQIVYVPTNDERLIKSSDDDLIRKF